MSDTAIEWTDKVWNPVTGCTKVSQGCKNCFAERVFPRAYGKERKFTDIVCHQDRLEDPLHWRKSARIFVDSMGDPFHEAVPTTFIRAIFAVMAQCPQHQFQLLTKRAERMLKVLRAWQVDGLTLREGCGVVLPNVWLGVSCEDQKTADERIPLLLQTPAAVRWISAEPLLGPVDLNKRECLIDKRRFKYTIGNYLDWVVVGGESGPAARPMHPDWARSLRDQCHAAGVPYFFKQWGEWSPLVSSNPRWFQVVHQDGRVGSGLDGARTPEEEPKSAAFMERVGKKAAGRLLDGREWSEYPA